MTRRKAMQPATQMRRKSQFCGPLLASADCRPKDVHIVSIIVAKLKFCDVQRHAFGAHLIDRAITPRYAANAGTNTSGAGGLYSIERRYQFLFRTFTDMRRAKRIDYPMVVVATCNQCADDDRVVQALGKLVA